MFYHNTKEPLVTIFSSAHIKKKPHARGASASLYCIIIALSLAWSVKKTLLKQYRYLLSELSITYLCKEHNIFPEIPCTEIICERSAKAMNDYCLPPFLAYIPADRVFPTAPFVPSSRPHRPVNTFPATFSCFFLHKD